MHMIFRTIVWFLLSARAPKLSMFDVGRIRLRVLPTDIDTLGHINNGVYLSLMDLGRVDLMVRAGAWRAISKLGFYPVVANETITFRKSLDLWKRFDLETRLIGADARAVFIEQRFVVDGEIYARAFVRARFLKKSGGTVSVDELLRAIGLDLSELGLPDWIDRWATDVGLPPTRSQAPSEW